MIEVVWTDAALSDLERIRAYIGHFNPAAARRMAIGLIETGNELTTFPECGRPIGGGRREVTTAMPYLILRVRHGAQAPE